MNNTKRSGGPTQTNFLAQNDLPSVTKSNNEVKNIMEKQIKANKSKNNKKFLTKAVKYAPKFAPELQATIPVVSDSRVLLNADSAVTGQPAKIIQRASSPEDKPKDMSRRKMKEARSKLSKNNFVPLPTSVGIQTEEESPPSIEKQIIEMLIKPELAKVRCYFCDGRSVGYVPDDDYWYNFACKRMDCLSDFKWHPLHGVQCMVGYYAITNKITNTTREESLIPSTTVQTPHKIINNNINTESKQKNVKKITFDNSGIRLKKKQAAINFVKLPFKEQKKVVGVGMRDVSTIPVQESLSYKSALEGNFKQPTLVVEPPKFNLRAHQKEYNRIKKLFFKTSRRLFDKWQQNKIDKKYKNPFLSSSKEILDRFWNEPTNSIRIAYLEWFSCASRFGDGTGKIINNWYA